MATPDSREPEFDGRLHDDPDTAEALDRVEELPDPTDYRKLRDDNPPGGETAREQGYGAPEDVFPPAEQGDGAYAETPSGARGGGRSPDEPLGDVPPLEPGPQVPTEAIDVMTEERSDVHDPAEELERCEEDPEYAAGSPTCGADEKESLRDARDRHGEESLDEAVMETFPASDPISPATPDRS